MFSNNKQADREAVLNSVRISIQQGMTSNSVSDYVNLARRYSQQYGISPMVEQWIMEGRTVFSSQDAAMRWANTLP